MGHLLGIARREKKRATMETLDSVRISADAGVAGDSRGKPGNRQVTLLSARDWRAACEDLGRNIDWTTRRANLFIGDLDLPKAPGHIIVIGDVRLKTTIEIVPCSRMDEQEDGLTDALKPDWRGGVGCEVLEGGMIAVGDPVEIIE
jgi:MOSC domain-containing protein YiiM